MNNSGIPNASKPESAAFHPVDKSEEVTIGISNGDKNPAIKIIPAISNFLFDGSFVFSVLFGLIFILLYFKLFFFQTPNKNLKPTLPGSNLLQECLYQDDSLMYILIQHNLHLLTQG
jgi:hypothetical protein